MEIPGGSVPGNASRVTVTLPDGITAFDIPKAQNDLCDLDYFRNLTQAGVSGFPTGTYTLGAHSDTPTWMIAGSPGP